MYKYFGKNVRITDADGVVWVGQVVSCESPADSEDDQWWLDVDVQNKGDFGELTIPEGDIKSIEII